MATNQNSLPPFDLFLQSNARPSTYANVGEHGDFFEEHAQIVYEIPLYPCLNGLSVTQLNSIERFLPVDRGNSMFCLMSSREPNIQIHLFRNGSSVASHKITLCNIQIKSMKTFSWHYFHLLSQSNQLFMMQFIYEMADSNFTNENLFLIMNGIVRIDQNEHFALALHSNGSIYYWSITPTEFPKPIPITSIPGQIYDFSCGKQGWIISTITCSPNQSPKEFIYYWPNKTLTPKILMKNIPNNRVSKIILGNDICVIIICTGKAFYFHLKDDYAQKKINLIQVTIKENNDKCEECERIVNCISLNMTDTFLFTIKSFEKYPCFLWKCSSSYQPEIISKINFLDSVPDLISFYSNYPSSNLKLVKIFPQSIKNIQDNISSNCPKYDYLRKSFHNINNYDFEIKFLVDFNETRSLYVKRSLLMGINYYRSTLEQFKNLCETIEFKFQFVEIYLYLKEYILGNLPWNVSIVNHNPSLYQKLKQEIPNYFASIVQLPHVNLEDPKIDLDIDQLIDLIEDIEQNSNTV